MRLRLSCLTMLVGILLAQSAALASPCEERSQWLQSMTSPQRDLVLLQTSANTSRKFLELVRQPKVTPATELWAYKILASGHYILSQSPYASNDVKPVFSEITELTSGIIRGKIAFATFQPAMKAKMTMIDMTINRIGSVERSFIAAHANEIERLSNCVLLTAMYNSSAKRQSD